MKPKGMYLSEDIDTINVMDYFEDSPAVDIKRDEQSLTQKLKNLLICN